jgi:L-threonylcarbamoyladenylate synthase
MPGKLPRIIKLKDLSEAEVTHVALEAAAVLKAGGTVIYPTETVYGIGVVATNAEAVTKVLSYKSRREGKPLSIAVTDQTMAAKFVEINQQASVLYERFLPGPMTVISKDLGIVAPGVASEFGTLGIRMPAHPLIMKVVELIQQPVTATSANGSGEKRPYTLEDIFTRLSDKQLSLIDLAIDAGTLPPNPPSTVIDTTLSTPLIMRQGAALSEKSQGKILAEFESNSPEETRQIAGKWLLKYWDQIKQTGLIIGLNGSLGAGKTVLTQGVGEFLQIEEKIISPTYNYLLEYPYQRHQQSGMLYHVDAWKIDTAVSFQQLELAQIIKPGTILIVEWWSQIEAYSLADPELGGFNPAIPILNIDINPITETQRQLSVRVLR